MIISNSEFCRLCEYSVENLVHPEDALRSFVGLPSREPFLVPRDVCSGRDEIARFLAVLSFLYQRSKGKFDVVAPTVKGTRRKYFGHTFKEVYSTGSNNDARQVPSTPWWVSVNSAGPRKARIVEGIMRGMNFGAEYTHMVASICQSPRPWLPFAYSKKYESLSKS